MRSEVQSWIRTERLARGWSQARLAELVGVQQPTISLWELGGRVPSAEESQRITEAFSANSELVPAPPAKPAVARASASAATRPGTQRLSSERLTCDAIMLAIKRLRIGRGINAKSFSLRSGIDPSQLAAWENLRVKPDLTTLLRLMNALEVGFSELGFELGERNEHGPLRASSSELELLRTIADQAKEIAALKRALAVLGAEPSDERK